MASKENQTESNKKTNNRSSASTPSQNSIKDAKEIENQRLAEKLLKQNEKIQKQMENFEEIFQKQIQMIEKQNQISDDLRRTLDNVMQKNSDSSRDQSGNETKKSGDETQEFVIFRNAYRNLAQRNLSKKEDIDLNVKVSQSYLDKMEEIRKNKRKEYN